MLACFRRRVKTDLVNRQCEVLAVIEAISQHLHVCRDKCRFLRELLLDEVNSLVYRPVKQPAHDAEGEHVTGFENRLVVQSRVFERLFGEARECHRYYLHRFGDIQLRERVVSLVLRFLQVGFGERVGIDDYHGMLMEQAVLHAHFEGGSVHCHNHVSLVARRINALTQVYLETAHTAQRALRCTNLGGKVG